MWSFRKHKEMVPQALKNIEDVVAVKERKISIIAQGQAVLFFVISVILLLSCTIVMIGYFYNSYVIYAQTSWLHVRNLTPVKDVMAPTSGVLDKVFVSAGQHVQKGALLASVRVNNIQLDYNEAKRDFAEKIVELHCFASLKVNKSTFKLPYDAQLLVDEMMRSQQMNYKVDQCERELLKNVRLDQALEEMIASLEDQLRVLDVVVKVRGMIEETLLDFGNGKSESSFPFGADQETLQKAYRDKYFPLMQFAIAQQDLREARASYFSRQLEKEEDLNAAIEQTTQDMRYLSQRLRDLDQKMKKNYIYAPVTGTIVGTELPQVGSEYAEHEAVFKLQPMESRFQISVVLNDDDTTRFAKDSPAYVVLAGTNENTSALLLAVSAGVFRQSNGKMEALLDLQGQDEKNAKAILSAGYKGEGEQRIKANVISGKSKIWHTLYQAVHRITPLELEL